MTSASVQARTQRGHGTHVRIEEHMRPDNTFPVTLDCVRGNPNAGDDTITLYTVEVPAAYVAQFVVESAHALAQGFQRPLDTARATRIGRLMGGDKYKGVVPEPNIHGGLLAWAEPKEIEFSNEGGHSRLTLKGPLRIVDGQHRAAGARWAVENGLTSDYTESVRIIVGATREQLIGWYLLTNIEARKTPPANVIANVAKMHGVYERRKSWVCRLVMALATNEPFVVDEAGLVGFVPEDAGVIAPQSLYTAVELMLPPELNREGTDVELEAARYVQQAFAAYAEAFVDWGERGEDGKWVRKDAYSFTMLTAYARVFAAIAQDEDDEDARAQRVQSALASSGVLGGVPSNFGSGARASVALASFIAGHADIALSKLAA